MAEALGRQLAADAFVSCSAGTRQKDAVNPDALRALARAGVAADGLAPKLLAALPPADIVVTMGCGVQCPLLPCRSREDWGLADPTGQDDEAFDKTLEAIRARVLDLRRRVLAGEI